MFVHKCQTKNLAKIKRTLQYPKAGSCVAAIAGHVNLFIFLFERLIEIEHSAAYQEFSAWTSSEGSDSYLAKQCAVTQNKLFLWDFHTPYLLVT
jgi:hypothetical protein